MGVGRAFESRGADFRGMSDGSELFLSSFVHHALISVDEKGTEAAAASLLVYALAAEETKPIVFRADHPFVVLIRHNPTRSILFLGRVVNPNGDHGLAGD
jgi:serpin B